MVSVKFIAQDINTKECTYSTVVYFDELDEAVKQLIDINRQKIKRAMPSARVVALIMQEDE